MASAGLHITDIWHNPEKFGFTPDQITALHAKHGERRGQEGKAREELMLDAMNRGWMRIRKRSRPDYWIVQYLPNMSADRRIGNWILDMVGDGHIHPNEEVRFAPIDASPQKVISARDYLKSVAA